MSERSLRVSSASKRIEVNDDGEYITLNASNSALIAGFGKLKKSLERMTKQFESEALAINQKDISEDDKRCEVMELNCSFCKNIMRDVDELIGPETCRKVFGENVVPDAFAIAEFFEAITPFIKEIAEEQAHKISKYSADRSGNL